MASILDLGLLEFFSGFIVFLLVYAVTWGILSWQKWPGDNPGVQALIAFTVAFLMAVAPPARTFISIVTPMYIAFAIVLFFILFIVSMFGMSPEKDFPDILKDSRTRNWIVIICVVIFVGGLAFMFGQTLLEQQPGSTPLPSQPTGPGQTGTNSFQENLLLTLINPKVMGLLLLFTIAALAIYFLSVQPQKH